MLRIFYTHPAKTSLLQDFAYYEVKISRPFPKLYLLTLDFFYQLQAAEKMRQQAQSPGSPPQQSRSPQPQLAAQVQQPFAMPAPYASQMGMPGQMMGMQMNSQYQNIMRNPSPVPVNQAQGYIGNF